VPKIPSPPDPGQPLDLDQALDWAALATAQHCQGSALPGEPPTPEAVARAQRALDRLQRLYADIEDGLERRTLSPRARAARARLVQLAGVWGGPPEDLQRRDLAEANFLARTTIDSIFAETDGWKLVDLRAAYAQNRAFRADLSDEAR
jgi:hypothetical protein